MPTNAPTISVRIPEPTKARLERIAKRLRRSRSSLLLEALERHLDSIQIEHSHAEPESKYAMMLKFKGVGAKVAGARSSEEIDASIRELRGDE